MRAYYRAQGGVEITLPPWATTELQIDPPKRSVVVEEGDYEELKDQILEGDTVRGELKRSLDDALSIIERLSDDRDHWQQAAENHSKAADLWKSLAERQDNTVPLRIKLDAVERERDEWKARAELGERTLAKYPIRVMTAGQEVHYDHVWTDTDRASADVLEAVAATAPVGSLVSDLKNTIVSQAREIVRLKGESE
ncbi:hypothetical protein AB0F77_39530 [Streptomyces sp. NPDC026672]|uniref:hypothetical protein n=1 Tax=Actinomycetes TaxID=1760 RepID=UPI0033DA0D10